jgi:hypothetical protein
MEHFDLIPRVMYLGRWDRRAGFCHFCVGWAGQIVFIANDIACL